MTKNEFQEIVKMLEKKVGRTMPDGVRQTYWNDFKSMDFETVKHELSKMKTATDKNGTPQIQAVIEGASEELTSEVNQLLNTLLTTEAGNYVIQTLEKFLAHKNKDDWAKEKKKYFQENNYTNISLN